MGEEHIHDDGNDDVDVDDDDDDDDDDDGDATCNTPSTAGCSAMQQLMHLNT